MYLLIYHVIYYACVLFTWVYFSIRYMYETWEWPQYSYLFIFSNKLGTNAFEL